MNVRILSIFLSVLVIPCAYAQKHPPASCLPLAVKGELAVLKAKKPVLMLIHNVSDAKLWITHPVSDPGASAGWSIWLEPGKWSALALNKKVFELMCVESKPGHEQHIPCEGMLAVCQWTGVTIPKNTAGTYWAAENMKLDALSAHLVNRGFILPTGTI